MHSNENESTVWVFESRAVRQFLNDSTSAGSIQPRNIARFSAAFKGDAGATGEAITEARWRNDGKAIVFLARDGKAGRQLFVVELDDGVLRLLSPHGLDTTQYDQVKDTVAFASANPLTDAQIHESVGPDLADVEIGTGKALYNLLFPRWEEMVYGSSPQQLWVVRDRRASLVIERDTTSPVTLVRGEPVSRVFSLSPSGRYVVAANRVAHIPEAWSAYEAAYDDRRFVVENVTANATADSSDNLYPAQYVLIDLERGAVAPLINSPLGFGAGYYSDAIKAVWSPDEQEVALANTFVPIRTSQSPRVTRPCVAIVKIRSHGVRCVKETERFDPTRAAHTANLVNLGWGASKDELWLQYETDDGNGTRSEVYRRARTGWEAVRHISRATGDNMASPGAKILVTVREGVNEPPALVATDLETQRSKEIWNPNPQLAAVSLGEARVYRWQDKKGHECVGGLVTPPDYHVAHRYPLVIQTHGFDPNKFITDGIYSTANAARPLASRGIVVLQVSEIHAVPPFSPSAARENGRAVYESAIEHLDADGVIDPKKVGIIGFSQTGWPVLDSLVDSSNPYVAATLADSVVESLSQYLVQADFRNSSFTNIQGSSIGALPFGEGLKIWLARSPGFKTDKIHVPILFEANSPEGLLCCWEIYASLRVQSKPVELLYIRGGDHVLMKPLEILASQQMTVDWYDFWLNGHEDPNQEKAEQYQRWEKLCDLQIAQNPNGAKFCVRTKTH